MVDTYEHNPPGHNTPEQTASLPSRTEIEGWARDLGFDAIGITGIDLREHEPHVRAYLEAGFQGDMGYLTRNQEKRLNPSLLEPGTISVISARMNYLAADTQPLEILEDSSKAYVSRYALGRDYHKVLRRRLAKLGAKINAALQPDSERSDHNPQYQYRAFTDSAPVLEKALAQNAGLGWMGKHTLLLDTSGSWFFIGEIFTNAPFPADETRVEDQCGKCNACITVCPTEAIVAPKVLDARRCISYLTIEHKGAIPEVLRAKMGNRVYGCDDCQLYCPWNRETPTTAEADFAPRHDLHQSDLLDLFVLTEAEFLKLTEGSAIRRVSYEQWQRNLAVAIGNGPASEEAKRLLQEKRATATPLVTEHIDWALNALGKR